jgi:hypothetical protein
VFRPFALAGGRAVALWQIDGRKIVLEPFGELAATDAAALRADAEDVVRFLQL